ncbi:FAD-dependent 5-carboxymethylaminomethyl-2-thiouridine(34) oxidoreductase MnmC [uncultured Xylophilus sp.]|uniref:FAD-dependent 5-carboxymethylaminomethyl-2-thiouridine(34) oxidoreductase MnmC n=1 Tax=uncultured Xylophilus sp. TaxID=296832 RepID=UPI0025D776F4|nr:FAD-dependent 5-carboxymethylaminomethyl-2-thiouridine(34) oxidoreductase MnmC [uncultured Xylophilus sp.]
MAPGLTSPSPDSAAAVRTVFLDGCGLSGAWAGAPQWRILATGFGSGLGFLCTWEAWRRDTARCGLLHVVAITPAPLTTEALRRAAEGDATLAPLADRLAAEGDGLLPGVHRLAFDDGRVLLTLCVGPVEAMLRALQRFDADSIYLDGTGTAVESIATVARFARRGTHLACDSAAPAVSAALTQQGFAVQVDADSPGTAGRLTARFTPAWEPRRPPRPGDAPCAGVPGHCAVVGAGIAGAALAASLARRGWQVTVLDAAAAPATGASGAPAALWAPHVSPDDALLSRLTRAGLRITRSELRAWLTEGVDWQGDGVLERRMPDDRLPAGWTADAGAPSSPADAGALARAGLSSDTPAWQHRAAGWVRPAALVQAWLSRPGVWFQGGCTVAQVRRDGAVWQLCDAAGTVRCTADRVIFAGGVGNRALAPGLPLHAVRGQLAWGRMAVATAALPALAVNGDGHWVGGVPAADGPRWVSGATFGRGDDRCDLRSDDTCANRERLERLLPGAAAALATAFDAGRVEAWAGVRCTAADRRPLVGPVDPAAPDGPWVVAALGSRGLSFAALCAELLTARWHNEPLPLPARLAAALDTARLRR